MSLKGKEILIIDGDPQYQILMGNVLASTGVKIYQAKSYKDAIDFLNEQIPHLIITEIDLDNDNSGIDIQRHCKESPALSKIPIVVITNDASKSTIFQSIAIGAQEYIIKPIATKQLIQKLRRIFRDYQSPSLDFLSVDGRYKSDLVVKFDNDFDIEIETDIHLRAINEVSCILQGPVKFPKGTIVDFQNDLINSIGGDGLGYRSIDNGRSIEAGTFSTRFSLVGIHEEVAKKIRQLRVTKK